MKNKHLLFLALLLVFGFTLAADAAVTTTRDDKGVWFVKGEASDSIYDVFEAVGYAAATDRLWQAETFRRAANGNLAEILGPDYLGQDMLVRMTGYSKAELTAGYGGLDAETREMIDGYVAGFNRRINDVTADPTQLPFEFHALARQLGLPILLPSLWTPEDVMAWEALMLRQFDPEAQRQGQLKNAALLKYLMTLFGQAQGMTMFNDLRWTNDPAATTYIPKPEALTGVSGAQVPAGPSALSPASIPDADLQAVAEEMENRWADRRKKLEQINAYVAMGSYAWVISGDKTASGRPILYSGPQMGFDTPAIVSEGSIDAAGLKISGMAIAGLPGIVIGRTPHHAWSMQVGHAHTVDYYFEPSPSAVPAGYYTSRQETIAVAGGAPVTLTVFRTPHGPVVNPMNFNPATYDAADGPIVSWRYSHWEKEFGTVTAFLDLAKAKSMDEFGAALRDVGVSQHFCYADKDGNIAYWMSGMDPVRPVTDGNGQPVDWRFPQGMFGTQTEWTPDLKPLSSDRNTAQGFYAGWNSKTSPDYENSSNNPSYYFGPFHRAHVLEEYLSANDNLTFEQVRDLAADIAATDSFGSGGNPWAFVEDDFRAAVEDYPSDARTWAIGIMNGFDGHFPAGGKANWNTGPDRSDAWMLSDAWIRAALDLTFLDELGALPDEYNPEEQQWNNSTVLFNVLLHALAGDGASIRNNYDWFTNASDPEAPQTAEAVIVAALDAAIAKLGARPWGIDKRGEIEFNHAMFNNPPLALNPLHTMPFASRSTYAHCVEMGKPGPVRIESMFPLGQSGNILAGVQGEPVFDANFFTMAPVFDTFAHRDFPVFAASEDACDDDDDSCFINTLLRQ